MKVIQFNRIPPGFIESMASRLWLTVIMLLLFAATPLRADRFIVQTIGGAPPVQSACTANGGCNVITRLGDPGGQFFLIVTPALSNPQAFVTGLLNSSGIAAVEFDQIGKLSGATATGGIPPALYDNTPISYFGTTVSHGYVNQPATTLVNLSQTQTTYNVAGAGTVAVIDTGVDSTHPVLQNVLVSGYDFILNAPGVPDEKSTVPLSNPPAVSGVPPAYVNDSTAAVVDDSTAAVVDN
jgi:hypothetical protein